MEIRRAHPDRVALALRRRPARGLAFDLSRLGIEERLVEIAVGRMREPLRVGDVPVAYAERALGRLDQAMHVFEGFRLGDPQALEQRQNHEGSKSLRRRRRIVERAGLQRDRERLGDARLIVFQVGARHR